MNMSKNFRVSLFDTLREQTRKHVEAWQTDLAIDIEFILAETDDITITTATWYGRSCGTNFAYTDEGRERTERCFSDIKVKVEIDFVNETFEVHELQAV